MAGRKKKVVEGDGGVPLWMVTYGDMMTLLLCFFILLFSFSTLDVVKFRDVIIELQGALGVLSGGPMVLNLGDIPARQITENLSASKNNMIQIQEQIKEQVEESALEGQIETEINERGLLIRFTDTVLFDVGEADLKSEVIPVLQVIAAEIAAIPNDVAIEGHTDPTPINTDKFPSNWWLASGRACAVLHWLIEEGDVPPERLQAAGFAYYRPVAPNNTPENRTRNRRVDVIILKTDEHQGVESRQEVLEFLESPDSDGIVMESPEDETEYLPDEQTEPVVELIEDGEAIESIADDSVSEEVTEAETGGE